MKLTALSLPAAAGLICVAASIAAAQAPAPPGRDGRGGGLEGGSAAGCRRRRSCRRSIPTATESSRRRRSRTRPPRSRRSTRTRTASSRARSSARHSPAAVRVRQPGDAQAFVAQLLTYDKNGDGKLAKDELPERMQVLMDRADANKDGFVDKAELTTFAEQAARRNPGEATPGPGGGGDRAAGRRSQTPPANPAE